MCKAEAKGYGVDPNIYKEQADATSIHRRQYDGDPEVQQAIIDGQGKTIQQLQHHIKKLDDKIRSIKRELLAERATSARLQLTIAEHHLKQAEDDYERNN